MKLLKHLVVIFSYIYTCDALVYHEDEYKPWVQYCSPISPQQSLNFTWILSADFWYITMWSKRDLMLTLQIALSDKEFSALTDTKLQDSCFFHTKLVPAKPELKVYFLEKKIMDGTFSLRSGRPGVIDFFKNNAYKWTATIVLSDNEHYVLVINEFPDGTREFYLASTSDYIPSDQWEVIHKKIDSYGFKKSKIYRTKSTCDEDSFVKKVKSGKY